MRFVAASITIVTLLLAATPGCRSGKRDLLEAELRTKERLLRESQGEVERTRAVNEVLERDFLQRQQGLPPTANSGMASPKDITLANGTGGVDNDGQPGDESLLVVIVPRDEDNQPVRAVGTLSISAWEILPGGVKSPLSTWDVSATDLRRDWKSGLLGSGYHVPLAWQKLPSQDRLRIMARFSMPDGRVFEADKDISIHSLPGTRILPPNKVMPAGPADGPKLMPE